MGKVLKLEPDYIGLKKGIEALNIYLNTLITSTRNNLLVLFKTMLIWFTTNNKKVKGCFRNIMRSCSKKTHICKMYKLSWKIFLKFYSLEGGL